METKNIFKAFISVMAVLLVTPLMAQVNYNTITDPEFEEYHELAEMSKNRNTSGPRTYRINMNDIMDSEAEEYHELAKDGPIVKADFTLLMRSAKHGYLTAVKGLLLAGADVNATTDAGMTALMYASYYGHTKVVDRLLDEENINVDAQNEGGYTALMFAAMNTHEEVVDLLVNKGKADKTLTSKKGFTAYDYAKQIFNDAYLLAGYAAEAGIDHQIAVLSRIMNQTRIFKLSDEAREGIEKQIQYKQQHGEYMGTVPSISLEQLREITKDIPPAR